MPIGQGRGLRRSPIERTAIRPALDVRRQDVEAARDALVLEQVTDTFDAFAGKGQLQQLMVRRRFMGFEG